MDRKTAKEEAPVIIEFPPDIPVRWLGCYGRKPGHVAAGLRRKGYRVSVIGKIVRILEGPRVERW